LSACPLEGLQEKTLRGGRSIRHAGAKKDSALHAQQFGKSPALLVAIRDIERPVDSCESLRVFSGAALGLCEIAQEACVAHVKGIHRDRVKRGCKHVRRRNNVALSAKEDRVPATPP
jgi:hypothetical protein